MNKLVETNLVRFKILSFFGNFIIILPQLIINASLSLYYSFYIPCKCFFFQQSFKLVLKIWGKLRKGGWMKNLFQTLRQRKGNMENSQKLVMVDDLKYYVCF